MLVNRLYLSQLKKLVSPGKVVLIIGPRRAGKTTLLKQFLEEERDREKVKFVLGDSLKTQEVLSSRDEKILSEFVEGIKLLVIDEVHFIPEVGYSLKLLVDTHPKLKIIATGSASLDLIHRVGEPLVGRKLTIRFYPFSIYELRRVYYQNDFALKEELEDILVYGLYPEIFLASRKSRKRLLLTELVESYLLRDILTLENLRYPFLLKKLLQLLAYQIGNWVSYHELSKELRVDVKTVEKYIWLLEKSFIIYPLPSFSRNLRNELKKSRKYYFVDLGVRNALIQNFTPWSKRADKGQLWENFVLIERLKRVVFKESHANYFFWRTKYGQEIDFLEVRGGKIYPCEFKLKRTKSRAWLKFKQAYPEAGRLKVINQDNFLEFVA